MGIAATLSLISDLNLYSFGISGILVFVHNGQLDQANALG